MKEYEINDETLAIIPNDMWNSIVIEDDYQFDVTQKPLEIVDYSCKYFGSSYPGRKEGSRNILNSKYKLPVVIEDSRYIIFFPTNSPEDDNCVWISLKNIKDYYKVGPNKTRIEFKNEKSIIVGVSYNSFNNQVMRASRLESIIRNRRGE